MDSKSLNGLLPIHKPRGMISKDVSRQLVRKYGRMKLGHVGTLDPMAEGVLPLLLGRATRLQDYLLEHPKTYEFDVLLGQETDTLDADGKQIREMEWNHVTEEALLAGVKKFIGAVEQIPPLFSAVKYKGRSLYKYARSSEAPEIPLEKLAKTVMISDLQVKSVKFPVITLNMTCSKGTYVRVLARDLAQELGTCGTVTRMVRSHAAGISLDSCHKIEDLVERELNLSEYLVPIDRIKLNLANWRSIEPRWTQRLRNGQTLKVRSDLFSRGWG